jgi:phage baseplate assembly protein V
MNIAFGKIVEVSAEKCLYRVEFQDKGFTSRPLPRIVLNSLSNKDESHLDVNEHVAVAMDTNYENGVILGAIYDSKNLPASPNKDVRKTTYSDGSFVEFNRATKKLAISSEGEVEILKSTNTKITASEKIILTPGTFIEVAGNSEFLTMHAPLNTALQAFRTAVNTELSKISVGLNAIVSGSYIYVPTTVDITSAKSSKSKTS